jgi:hypothetical protein
MNNLKFTINAEEMAAAFGEMKQAVETALTKGVQSLASMTHQKTIELANAKLKSTRKIYTDNLSFEQVAPSIWVVSLSEPALWIEEGRKAGSMVDDLLRKGAKTSKDGNRYKAIPFEHSKPSSQQTSGQKDLVALIKSTLKTYGLGVKKIEYDQKGSPRVGRLHSFNINSPFPSPRASTPALFGLTVYQSKTPGGNVRRDVMTFRMVSDKHKGNKWIHPGRDADKFMDAALAWAEKEWEQNVLPSILKEFE